MKNFFWNIKRIVKWLPILWNNFDWDGEFLFEIMAIKLKFMEDHFYNDASGVGQRKESHKIKIARILCERIVNDEYYNRALFPVELKWGKLIFTKHGLGTTFENVKDDTEYLMAHDDDWRAIMKSERQKIADIKYLFSHMSKYVQGWVD